MNFENYEDREREVKQGVCSHCDNGERQPFFDRWTWRTLYFERFKDLSLAHLCSKCKEFKGVIE